MRNPQILSDQGPATRQLYEKRFAGARRNRTADNGSEPLSTASSTPIHCTSPMFQHLWAESGADSATHLATRNAGREVLSPGVRILAEGDALDEVKVSGILLGEPIGRSDRRLTALQILI